MLYSAYNGYHLKGVREIRVSSADLQMYMILFWREV